jgi:folate-binding protein YgfZ
MFEPAYNSLTVTGPDAFALLQAQLSNDLRLLDSNERLLTAWCNPKGRVICMLRVIRLEDDYQMSLPAALTSGVLKRLQMFRFRSKVDFTAGPASADLLGITKDQSVDDWLLHNLRSGVPEIWQPLSESFTPHMLNLDKLDAISLGKGCYPGQEIVARTHYRGASKRRMLRYTTAAPVLAGAAVTLGEQKIGEVVNAINTDLLAILPLEQAGDELTCEGLSLQQQPLPYSL